MVNVLFRLSIFGDFRHVEATPKNVVEYMNALNKDGATFLPQIIEEPEGMPNRLPFPPSIPAAFQVASHQRLNFSDTVQKCNVRIVSNRVDAECALGERVNTDDLGEVASQLLHYLGAMIELLPSKVGGTRLAFYIETAIPADNDRLFSFCKASTQSILRCTSGDPVDEYSIRINSRRKFDVGGKPETCNVISSVELVDMVRQDINNGTEDDFHGLSSKIDINTMHEISEPRFELKNLDEFYRQAVIIYSEIIGELEGEIT